MRRGAADSLLDTYQAERSVHVRELTTRIKDIGRVICERDVAAAQARDKRLLAEAGGVIKTIARQDIVPSLRTGLLSGELHLANGTLFPQPRVRDANGIRLLDEVVRGGWWVVTREAWAAASEMSAAAKELDMQVVSVRAEDETASGLPANGAHCLAEIDGVLEIGSKHRGTTLQSYVLVIMFLVWQAVRLHWPGN